MCDASMDGLTRLVNQTTANGGRVETCVNGGFWRPVCEGNWNEVNAKVVCRQLGLSDEGKWVYNVREHVILGQTFRICIVADWECIFVFQR